jgi:DNA-binding MarR family transcriptional regulator
MEATTKRMSDDREPLRAWLDLLGVSTAIKKGVDARLRERFGVSLSRFDVMAALDRAGEAGLTGKGLSARLKVTEGNTTQVTAPLIADGLVRRSVSAEDGRVAIFQLTAKGERLFARMAEANRGWIAEAFGALSPVDTAMLRRLLASLTAPSTRGKSP